MLNAVYNRPHMLYDCTLFLIFFYFQEMKKEIAQSAN